MHIGIGENIGAIHENQFAKHARKAEPLSRTNKVVLSTTGGFLWEVLPGSQVYDARTKEGGSGGPLMNYQGQVIGVNVALSAPYRYSNPISSSAEIIDSLLGQKPIIFISPSTTTAGVAVRL